MTVDLEKWNKFCSLANEMTGGYTDDPLAAFEQWEAERQALQEIHDANQAFSILFRRFKVCVEMAAHLVDDLEKDAGLFIKQKQRDKITQFREQIKILEGAKAFGRDIAEHAQEREHTKGIDHVRK